MLRRLVILGLLVVGCAHSPRVTNPPAWVDSGTGAYQSANGTRTFRGVGVATDPQRRKETAEARARVEVAKILNTYIANLFKSYGDSCLDCDPPMSEEESKRRIAEFQQQVRDMKAFAAAQLQHVEIRDHWMAADGTKEFALAILDFDNLRREMVSLRIQPKEGLEGILSRADQKFEDLLSEEEIGRTSE